MGEIIVGKIRVKNNISVSMHSIKKNFKNLMR